MRPLGFKAFCLILITLLFIQSTKAQGKEEESSKTKPELFDLNQIPSSPESPFTDGSQAISPTIDFGRGVSNLKVPPPRSSTAPNKEATYSSSDSGDELIGSHQNTEVLSWSVPESPSRRFPQEIVDMLREAFNVDSYLGDRKKELAEKTELTPEQVCRWFKRERKKNNRIKEKKNPISEELSSSVPESSSRRFPKKVVYMLREAYKVDSSLPKDRKEDLAEKTGLTPQQVRQWFKHEGQRKYNKRNPKESAECEQLNSSIPESSSSKRFTFTPEITSKLSAAYGQKTFLDLNRRKELAAQLGLTMKQIEHWSSNRKRTEKRRKARADLEADPDDAITAAKLEHIRNMERVRGQRYRNKLNVKPNPTDNNDVV